jgi:hypothetical protein
VPSIQDSVNTKSFLPHNKNIVTFKDLRRIITENRKLDDDKIARMRLRLWPTESGNGHNRIIIKIMDGDGDGRVGLLSHQKNGRS